MFNEAPATGSSSEPKLKEHFDVETSDPLSGHPIFDHIKQIWPQLIFDHEDLLLGGADNPLICHKDKNPYFIYVSDKEDPAEIQAYYQSVKQGILDKVSKGLLSPDKLEKYNQNGVLDIEVRPIPRAKDGTLAIPHDEHGLLHIPGRGVSPGLERFPKGILFNWDTAFIIRALVQTDRVDLAKDLTDVMLYEIEHYGGIPNANATFSLSDDPDVPRCQPPFIASKVLMIYNLWDELDEPQTETKEEWLKRALPLVEKHHEFWTKPGSCHFDDKLQLSKYGSTFGKPTVEVLHAEPEHYITAYQKLLELYEKHIENPLPVSERDYQGRKDGYYVEMFLDLDEDGKPVPFQMQKVKKSIDGREIEVFDVKGLTPAYYNGDIAMRESGLDATRRFGFMAADANNLCPYDLNCKIKKMEGDIGQAYAHLSAAEPENGQWAALSEQWSQRSEETAKRIRDALWDDARPQFDGDDPNNPDRPMPPSFRDLYLAPEAEKYNLGKFRRFNFAAIGTPLWTGVANDEQASTLIEDNFYLFLNPHGFRLSTNKEDYMWGGNISFSTEEEKAAEGAELNGYYHLALHMRKIRKNAIEKEFERTGHLWEKMETVTGTHDTGKYQAKGVGYNHNDPGFGWTIAEYIDACLAIPRLELKIKHQPIPSPCISSNFVVLDHGLAAPAKDSPQSLAKILRRANERFLKENPTLQSGLAIEPA